jgi:protein ImuB
MKPQGQGELPFAIADKASSAAAVVPRGRPATVPWPRVVPAGMPSPAAAPAPAAGELWLAVRLAQPERFAAVALTFTSRASIDAPDVLLLELRGSLRLFGGFLPLLVQLRGQLPEDATYALAPVPLAAAAFVRAGRALRCTDLARMREQLRDLPLAGLPWPDDTLARLISLGLATIGDVQRLPRDGFARRFGPAALALLDRLFGRRPDPRRGLSPQVRFRERIDLPLETVDDQRILRALGPTLERLEVFLRSHQRGLLALRVELRHRHAAPTACVLRLARPGFRATDFSALLAGRLARERWPEPVRELLLCAGRLVECPVGSGSLWRPGEQGGRLAAESFQLLERPRSRLGESAVQGVALMPGHRPERTGVQLSPDDCGPDAAVAVGGMASGSVLPWPPAQSRRPLWLLREPQPLVLRGTAGRLLPWLDDQPLTLLHGPERIESGWWDGADVRRDYYVARDGLGARWWIFRELATAPAWFLHGCFG